MRLEITDDCRTAPQVRARNRLNVDRARRMRPPRSEPRRPPGPQTDDITAVHLVDDVTPVECAARLALILAHPAPAISRIMQAVCNHYRISLTSLVTADRHKKIMRPTAVAMFLCRMLTDHSSPEIGRRLGDRGDSTVLGAVYRIAAEMDRDPELAEDIDAIRARLRP